MAIGKGGKSIYWYTEADARTACEGVLAGVKFVVTVPPQHQFILEVGKRIVAAQWISAESEFGSSPRLIAHITMSIDKLTLSLASGGVQTQKSGKRSSKSDASSQTFHAKLEVSNLHYTVRKKDDSVWIENNIKQIEADQKAKKETPTLTRYKFIQACSIHRGLINKRWNSGNKDNSEKAMEELGITSEQALPSDLEKVKGLIASVGSSALRDKVFTHGKKDKQESLQVSTAEIVVQ